MDNITHSVVGLGIGALIDRCLPDEPDAGRQRLRTRVLLTLCCLASNFPDLDLLLTHRLEAPLGYLLMHRGHTHTLVGALAELVVLLGLTWLLWPNARALLRASAHARVGALAAGAIGLLLHIGMDGLNVYGVHPFWPVDPSWYYGDLVFIVEPVFWIGFGIPLAAMAVRARLRLLTYLGMAAVLVGATLAGFLAWWSLAGLAILALALGALGHRARARPDGRRSRVALAAGLTLSIGFVGAQALALQHAREALGTALRAADPGQHVLDMALSAYPANPLCWSFVSVERDDGHHGDATLHLRRGLLSVAPGVAPVGACPASLAGAAPVDAGRALAWQADDRMPLALLRTLRRTNCHVDAWLRFARAPVLAAGIATDERWGQPGVHNFSSLWYDELATLPCPHGCAGLGLSARGRAGPGAMTTAPASAAPGDLPRLVTARTVMLVLPPERVALLQAYRTENRDHLAPWEPARTPDYFGIDAARAHLDDAIAQASAGSALQFVALARTTGDDTAADSGSAIVATCAFTNIVRGPFQACHLGFSVAAPAQGEGLMHEVVAAGIDHMFRHGGLHRVMANHSPRNTRSAALLQRLGFEREGYARSYLRIDGRWEDMVLNSLICTDDA